MRSSQTPNYLASFFLLNSVMGVPIGCGYRGGATGWTDISDEGIPLKSCEFICHVYQFSYVQPPYRLIIVTMQSIVQIYNGL